MNETIHNQLTTKGYYTTKINPTITEKLKLIFMKVLYNIKNIFMKIKYHVNHLII